MAKILLVDDVEFLLDTKRAVLTDRGLDIATASSGEEALDIHRKEPAEVIVYSSAILDISGKDFCVRFKKEKDLKPAYIVMTLSRENGDIPEEYQILGANSYIFEPIEPIEFLQKVETFLNVAKRIKERIFVKMKVMGTYGPTDTFVGSSVNISGSGFQLETGRTFHVGEECGFTMTLPDTINPITVKGIIVREAKGEKQTMKYYGIKFSQVNDSSRKAIENYVKYKK